ncbi:MAG: CAP domain-containing protein [Kofleriaceae bacterium]
MRHLAPLLLLAGCLDRGGPDPDADPIVDDTDDLPDAMGLRLTAAELAADEARSGEPPLATPAEGAYAWEAMDRHAARFDPHREAHGETGLVRSACLDAIARRWSLRMASGVCGDDPICHRGDGGASGLQLQVSRCWSWSAIGENVALNSSEAGAWIAFLDSPPHHANIDGPWNDGGSGRFGVGVFQRADGAVFVTQVFARR